MLKWSEPRKPGEDGCVYDHVMADTPFGRLVIEWKSWKRNDPPGCKMPWKHYITGATLDEAKRNVQASWDEMSERMAILATKEAEYS